MREILNTVDEQLDPKHTAVVVVDMQNDFCAEGGYLHTEQGQDMSGTAAIAANIMTLVTAARQVDVPIVWIRAIYDFKYLSNAHIAKRGKEGCCLEGTWGADFYQVTPAPEDVIIDKHCFSAFSGTDLQRQLTNLGVKTLLITGVATNVCVDSTLRDGFFHGYYIVVAEDGVGSGNQAGHDGTLATVRRNIGAVMPSSEVIELLQRHQLASAAQ